MTVNTNLVFVIAVYVACISALAVGVAPQLGVHGVAQLFAPAPLTFESKRDGSMAEPGDGPSREGYGPMAYLGASELPY